jgi:RNA polymerase-interacting CarD/CdnL/TRCF family regulator
MSHNTDGEENRGVTGRVTFRLELKEQLFGWLREIALARGETLDDVIGEILERDRAERKLGLWREVSRSADERLAAHGDVVTLAMIVRELLRDLRPKQGEPSALEVQAIALIERMQER